MGKMWFRPKTFGYGAGLPIAWQGWAVLAIFCAAIFGLHWFVVTYVRVSERLVVQTAGLALAISATLWTQNLA